MLSCRQVANACVPRSLSTVAYVAEYSSRKNLRQRQHGLEHREINIGFNGSALQGVTIKATGRNITAEIRHSPAIAMSLESLSRNLIETAFSADRIAENFDRFA